jgi:hypothetical protein
MFTVTDPQKDLLPGDIGFKTDLSFAGRIARAGQWLLRDDCRFWHAFIVVSALRNEYGMQCVEAMSSGARVAWLDDRTGPAYGYVRLPLSDEQRVAASARALDLVAARGGRGVPYSFVDYLALMLEHHRVPGRQFVREYVKSSQRMICSQLVDFVLCEVGFHLFNDGRLPQDVTPGDLFWQAGAVGQAYWSPVGGPAKSYHLPSSDHA